MYNFFTIILAFSTISCSKTEAHESQQPPVIKNKLETFTQPASGQGTSNVMTYNILWDKKTSGNTQWRFRRESLVDLIDRHNPDIVGIQEGFKNQVDFISTALGYEYFGFGTEDGLSESENSAKNQSLNPILFNPQKWTIKDKGVFWYSDNPDQPNLGYADSHFRNCVWGKFKENGKNGKTVFVFNTHFSLRDEIREKQAILLKSMIKNIAGEDALTIVVGDFNSAPGRDNSFEVLTNDSLFMNLVETKDISTSPLVGPNFTGSGLKVNSRTSGHQVDHIFVRNIKSCSVHKIITDYKGDYYPSDHFPVLTTISF